MDGQFTKVIKQMDIELLTTFTFYQNVHNAKVEYSKANFVGKIETKNLVANFPYKILSIDKCLNRGVLLNF